MSNARPVQVYWRLFPIGYGTIVVALLCYYIPNWLSDVRLPGLADLSRTVSELGVIAFLISCVVAIPAVVVWTAFAATLLARRSQRRAAILASAWTTALFLGVLVYFAPISAVTILLPSVTAAAVMTALAFPSRLGEAP